jgi:uncharacterized membrane protein YeaQ/YmgE (transglycosylase-associated protein family)
MNSYGHAAFRGDRFGVFEASRTPIERRETVGEILVYIVVGAVVGIVARLLMPGRDPVGFIGTIVIGIVGAVIGGYAWRALFKNTEGVEWIGSILVAMLLLWIYRQMTYRRTAL